MRKLMTETIYRLADFAQAKGLIQAIDRPWAINRLMEICSMDAPEEIDYSPAAIPETASRYLDTLAGCAVKLGLIGESGENRDLFAARLMGALTPSPAEVRETFASLYTASPEAATDRFYRMCRDCDYIKVDRIAKNVRWFSDTPAGRLEITVNLSKPEKDPRDIAAQRSMPQHGYPKCMLCVENPGYAGRVGFPARQNHRMIPLTLGGDRFYLQYSPYLYYNEHCIVLNAEHVPMHIDRSTFDRLFDFVGQFPHYFLGSNADLPIVGGSILSHDHFQGGHYRFPMDEAGDRLKLHCPVPGVRAALIDWPMTCIRLRGRDRGALTNAAMQITEAWRGYTDEDHMILAETEGERHNTVTPILRLEEDEWKLDLVLRNNLTTPEHPLGLYHPHEELHHIKKENIGLIEVMGLFILPGRLVSEMKWLSTYLTGETPMDRVPPDTSPLRKHWEWLQGIAARTGCRLTPAQATETLRSEIGLVCAQVLRDAGVCKDDETVLRFTGAVWGR